jgi:hypothetical protein
MCVVIGSHDVTHRTANTQERIRSARLGSTSSMLKVEPALKEKKCAS